MSLTNQLIPYRIRMIPFYFVYGDKYKEATRDIKKLEEGFLISI
jgi:hypothetical protein